MTRYNDVMAVDNGARFHHVDLHIHTYGGSSDVKDPTMTPEAVIDAAIAQKLSVIAITEHNSNKSIERALAHTQKYLGQILVLPGVEVTTAHGHLLVYFAPERAADLAKFLSRLDLVGEMGDDNTHTAKSMADCIKEAYSLGGICIAAHIDRERTGFDKFTTGFQNWKKDIITSPGLYGLECDVVDALKWYSDLDESGSEGVERRKLFTARQFVEELKARHHLAHVQGSDSHSMMNFHNANPDKKWTRVKLTELSFNALRVALIDPTARVRACGSVPRTIPRVIGVAMSGGFLHNEVIHFSDNLNCFIGGRGTGKSTAIRALAYGFGQNEDFGIYDNCPDQVTIFCDDTNGVLYRYSRARGGDIEVKARDGSNAVDMPADSFRIEYFGQGELAEVAKDPLNNPQKLQDFLDRHTTLRDLADTEAALVTNLRENSQRLTQLEIAFIQQREKKNTLAEIEQKLKVAQEGNLAEVVGEQSKIASEKAIRGAVETIATEYTKGFNFTSIERDYSKVTSTVGIVTGDTQSQAALDEIKRLLDAINTLIRTKAAEINAALKQCARDLSKQVATLKTAHMRLDGEVATKLADLKSRGLAAGNMAELKQLIDQKSAIGKDIATVELKANELKTTREERARLLKELSETRRKMTDRRKAQLKGINDNLGLVIQDYKVFVKYDDEGITDGFQAYLQTEMTGTYVSDEVIGNLCRQITPAQLSEFVLARETNKLAVAAKLSSEQAQKFVEKLRYYRILFELQVLAKPPKPKIMVLTKSVPAKEIPVFQLSDGQRHTILLTIAMLADSNVPLVIDQPEDDLDNAFIFSSIVTTLRTVKERRQVIVVTHNANIAVLGDSELILPMFRENDCGKAIDRGAIDSSATKKRVQNVLEGGIDAFLRRKEIYGH